MTTARVISEGLTLRERGHPHAKRITELARGDIVELLGTIEASGWAYVRVAKTKNGIQVGLKGWVDSAFFEVEAPPPPDIEEPYPPEPMPETEPIPLSWAVAAIGVVIIVSVAWRLWWGPLWSW